ncbi:hypothetical protein GCM10023194_47320 [Planotetraspora phitsanulokensis]|uniref:Uncharacterized protein n=1 Tax=Planotetraspora phitsanulokensis TaxID=575192 RepID=A0A8J3XJ91_9ACTN|nr:hypothetical protein [Planotetraspora phitsanulokensis]GII43174.1 hypothetical protein Pph01_81770 [Planotetraspora phitsanulokensis]
MVLTSLKWPFCATTRHVRAHILPAEHCDKPAPEVHRPQPPQGQYPSGQYPQPYASPAGFTPVPHPQQPAHPQGFGYSPVQMTTVKQRGFNPITLLIHLFLWVFVHSWLIVLPIGFWLLIAIPVTFIGWNVKKTVPVQHMPGQLPPRSSSRRQNAPHPALA